MARKNKILDNKQYTFSYVPGHSFMHKLNPISKIVFLIFLTISIFLITSLIFLSIILFGTLTLALLSNISLNNLARKLRFAFFILIFGVILNIFFNAIPLENETILFYLFGLSFLPIRRLALYYAVKAFLIFLTLYTSAIIYTYTTSMKNFVYSLMRLKIPYKYCYALMVGIRFIPSIQQEARTIALAQKARGLGLEKANSARKAYNLIFERLISTLVSILRKGNTISISMENRSFGLYKTRTNLTWIKYKKKDALFIWLIFILFIVLVLYILQLLPFPSFPSLYHFYINLL